jgi:hypothetical protein
MAQHKRHKRIGEARTPAPSASPIVEELAYYLGSSERKRKYVHYKMRVG